MYSALFISVFLIWAQGLDALDHDGLRFTEHLDQHGNVTLKWGFEKPKNEITFLLSVRTTGWVGLGFSPNGGMTGADITIGGVAQDGSTYFSDRHAVGNSLPIVDKMQNCTLLSLTEVAGQTIMKFRRPIVTCNEEDYSITKKPIKLIYAFGETDELVYHASRRGTKAVNLLNFALWTTPPNSSYFDVTATNGEFRDRIACIIPFPMDNFYNNPIWKCTDNYTIPEVHTNYHCWIKKLPTLATKHHLFRIEPVIRNLGIVHHMILYECNALYNRTEAEGDCYGGALSRGCGKVMVAWAIGGQGNEFPDEAGVSIGAPNDVTFVRLEVHYDNPNGIKGLVDDSGLRLHYTSNLRKHDASVIDFGLSVFNDYAIPPNAEHFKAYSVCNTSDFTLLDPAMPDLTIFMTMLHTHLAGRMIRVGHFRNGVQIGFLDWNEEYDFSYQEASYLGKVITVKPGDIIVTECTFNTMGRTTLTKLGLTTSDEMCFAFVYYYPAINVGSCWSVPDLRLLENSTGVKSHDVTSTMLQGKDWNNVTIAEYENTLISIPQVVLITNVLTGILRTTYMPEMKATPKVSCRSATSPGGGTTGNTGNAGNGLVISSPRVMLLLWLAVLYLH